MYETCCCTVSATLGCDCHIAVSERPMGQVYEGCSWEIPCSNLYGKNAPLSTENVARKKNSRITAVLAGL